MRATLGYAIAQICAGFLRILKTERLGTNRLPFSLTNLPKENAEGKKQEADGRWQERRKPFSRDEGSQAEFA
jgi:hypothetical protein